MVANALNFMSAYNADLDGQLTSLQYDADDQIQLCARSTHCGATIAAPLPRDLLPWPVNCDEDGLGAVRPALLTLATALSLNR